MTGGLFRTLRVALLLVLLFFVAAQSWLTHLRTTDWKETLWVVVYPINGDGSDTVRQYIDNLSADVYAPVSDFFAEEAARYRLGIQRPVTVKLGPEIRVHPPAPPQGGSVPAIMWWSLKLRFWAMRHDTYDGPQPDARLFVLYHDPARQTVLRHSLGLEKGLIGVVNAYAGRTLASRNNLVISHEFLHTVGASDKYDPATSQPLYPDGFAEPNLQPLFPQKLAEVMGGRIPISETSAVMPRSMRSVRIGTRTAREIRWVD